MRRVMLVIGLLLIGLTVVAGCASPRRGPAYGRVLAIDSEPLARGQKVFMDRCYGCHPGGDAGLGPALNNKPLPRFLMRFQVRHGLGTMPSFKDDQIDDKALDDLLTYVVALRKAG